MWAQMIKVRLKDGSEAGLQQLIGQLRDAEQADSGLVRSLAMCEQHDPNALTMLVLFESEDKARARENDPRRADGLAAARATMAEIFEGAPSFTDMIVVEEFAP